MKVKKYCGVVVAFLCSFTLSSCQCIKTVNLYPGQELPPDKVATLAIHSNMYIAIDGEAVDFKPGLCEKRHINFLPGSHKISWREFDETAFYSANFAYKGSGELDAKAGRTYRICYSCILGKRTERSTTVIAHASWIEERSDEGVGKVVVGVRPSWAVIGSREVPPWAEKRGYSGILWGSF